MTAAGIIFSNLHDRDLTELTRVRTMASIPFACRYRLVDFPLSNMVNAGISDILVITHYNYLSLMNHIGSGKDWDLARRSGGVTILPPYITAYASRANSLYSTRLEALKGVRHSIGELSEDYVVLSDCGTVANLDLAQMLRAHAASGADITMAVKRVCLTPDTVRQTQIVVSDGEGRVTDIVVSAEELDGYHDASMHVWIMGKNLLCALVTDAVSHNFDSFTRDILQRNVRHMDIRAYAVETPVALIRSFAEYYRTGMRLLRDGDFRAALFSTADRPVYTKVHNSPPTVYTTGSAKNCLIADGCTVLGSVEGSILFRGARVEEGACVRDSVLFENAVVGRGASLQCVVADKNTAVREGRELSGCEVRPYYIEKGMMI